MWNHKLFAFRVDSSTQIGSGHLIRCLTLATGLRAQGHDCRFVCRALEGNLNYSVSSAGFELIELPSYGQYYHQASMAEPYHGHWRQVDVQTDAEESLAALSDLDVDWLIVDHYGLWETWELAMVSRSTEIMVIDDLADRKHHCDILLDQNLGSDQLGYAELIPRDCKTLHGPGYAILRPEFKEYRKHSLARRQSNKVDNILINFGGGDPNDYIVKTLRSLLEVKIPQEITISVIFGGMSVMRQEHEDLITEFSNKVETYGSVQNMASMLAKSDLVIGAAGSSVWERCCLGVPSILFPIAVNQRNIAAQLEKRGAAIVLDHQDLMNGRLGHLINDLLSSGNLNKMSTIAADICDGSGLDKIMGVLNA